MRSCWSLLFFDIYVYVMYTRQWRRKSLYQKLLFAWLRTFWQMLLHFYDRIVTQVMYKNMYITTLLPAIQLAFEKCSVFLIEIRNLAIWWLRYHPKLYVPSTFETQMNLVPFCCWDDLAIRAVGCDDYKSVKREGIKPIKEYLLQSHWRCWLRVYNRLSQHIRHCPLQL